MVNKDKKVSKLHMKETSIKTLSLIGIMTALTCILGPLSIPIGPVPISFTNLVIYMAVIILGWKRGTVSYLVYLLIGLVGVPVFSGFAGGPGKLFGPTGGYLIGFIFMAMIGGYLIEKFHGKLAVSIGALALGTVVCYLFGTSWLAYQANMDFKTALFAGVIPFIIGDIVKILIATFIGPIIKKQLGKAGLL